jgi:SAM-dependent methyltransferase
MTKEKISFYKEHPKTCDPSDFWGQVKRTVNGVPVTQDQIDMIVDAVVNELELTQSDVLLDLCCGNGALSTLLFKYCDGGLGVDFSDHLISIANKNFLNPPHQTYILQDIVEFCSQPISPLLYTKMVCYGSFSYLEYDDAKQVLLNLNENFPNLLRGFIGNCPNKELLVDFYKDGSFEPGTENNPDSPIGIWRTPDEFITLAKHCGWTATIHKMSNKYYASHYRYDVILTR